MHENAARAWPPVGKAAGGREAGDRKREIVLIAYRMQSSRKPVISLRCPPTHKCACALSAERCINCIEAKQKENLAKLSCRQRNMSEI